MSLNSSGQHLLQTTKQGEGRVTRASEKEREETRGGGAQVDRGPGLRARGGGGCAGKSVEPDLQGF